MPSENIFDLKISLGKKNVYPEFQVEILPKSSNFKGNYFCGLGVLIENPNFNPKETYYYQKLFYQSNQLQVNVGNNGLTLVYAPILMAFLLFIFILL